MRLHQQGRRQSVYGFSLLELVVVIAMMGVLVSVALYKLSQYVQEAERVAVMTLEGELRNTLLLEAAKRILNRRDSELSNLHLSNPMKLLLETPRNYLGEFATSKLEKIEDRHWFFDLSERELVYRRGAQWAAVDGADIRYQVRIAYTDRDGDGNFAANTDELLGVRLARLSAF